jgi:hypothetical protein
MAFSYQYLTNQLQLVFSPLYRVLSQIFGKPENVLNIGQNYPARTMNC